MFNYLSMRFGVPDKCPRDGCNGDVKETGGSGKGTVTWECKSCGHKGSSSSGW